MAQNTMYYLVGSKVVKKEITLMKYETLQNDHHKPMAISLVENFVSANNEDIKKLILELKSIEHKNVLKVFGLTFVDISAVLARNMFDKQLQVPWSGTIRHVETSMHNGIPKLTNIWMSKFRLPNKFSFVEYCPPEILSSSDIIPNKMKLDIYRLGVLLWEISSNGIEPFSKSCDQLSLINDIKNGIHNRPNCANILVELNAQRTTTKSNRYSDPSSKYEILKVEFVNHFSLNKGRNYNKYDFVHGEGIILRDDGELKVQKTFQSSPIIYFSKKGSVTSDVAMEVEPEKDYIRINIPICTVQYQITEIVIGGAITIKNWSKIDDTNKSRLKTYFQWGIDYAKGKRLEIFEDVLLDGLPPLPSFEASETMKSVGDLYAWLKNLYSYKNLEIISYENFKPSYQSLPDDLIQQIFECSNLQHLSKSCSALVPHIPSQYDSKDALEWIKMTKPPSELYMRDCIQNNLLQHGILLQCSKLGHGIKPALKFLMEPKITPMNKVTILISQPKTLQAVYLLENGVILKEDELELDSIPFSEYSSLLNRPLEDFNNSKNYSEKIYCQIIFHALKISFDPSSIKCLEQFSDAVNSALESYEPFKGLCKLFGNDYGHLLPRTFTLGGVLSKTFKSCDDLTNFIHERQFEFEGNDPDAPREIEEILKIWNGESQDIDTSLFLDYDGNIVHRNNIGDWWKTLADSPNNWKVTSSEDWIPLYKILNNAHKIEAILDDNYHIVFNGENSLYNNQTTVIINFPGPIENTYYIFGNVVEENNKGGWERVPDITVRFDYQNKHGCAAYILKNSDNLKLIWFVLAKPNGYYSNKNRNVKLAYGELDIDGNQSNVTLNSENISSNCVLMTSFVSRTLKDTVIYDTILKDWTKATIELEIQREERDDNSNQKVIKKIGLIDASDEDSSDDSESTIENNSERNPQEKMTLRWCIVYANEREPMKSEDKGTYPWNAFGIVLNDNFKKD
ncbi:9061_t:CDS:2 [Dentiscutata erythropus]|uniref:9061_t:CDS:1 n=1 Tax=Dentiscutata erythropus TaxID=1348616 RepID=A0A9N8VEG8_9GLOM|nr:9061_t:CDS:2 [Dentiscutata erythropus]